MMIPNAGQAVGESKLLVQTWKQRANRNHKLENNENFKVSGGDGGRKKGKS